MKKKKVTLPSLSRPTVLAQLYGLVIAAGFGFFLAGMTIQLADSMGNLYCTSIAKRVDGSVVSVQPTLTCAGVRCGGAGILTRNASTRGISTARPIHTRRDVRTSWRSLPSWTSCCDAKTPCGSSHELV